MFGSAHLCGTVRIWSDLVGSVSIWLVSIWLGAVVDAINSCAFG